MQHHPTRKRADGVVVGLGTVGTDLSDGVAGNGLGRWEITADALADGAYQITFEAEDQAGNISVLSSPLSIWIDTTRPNTPHFDLVDASDTGRDNEDNVTRDNTPTLTSAVDDLFVIGSNPFPNDIRYRIYDRAGTAAEVILVESFAALGGNLSTLAFFTDTLTSLADAVHNLRLELEDRAGNIADILVTITVDTTAPAAPTIAIDPATTDPGVTGYPATFTDRVTSATAPGFVGTAEADTLVRLFAGNTPGGLNVALPSDGNRAFPNGQWKQAGVNDLNNPSFYPHDGVRVITATAEDLAGNVSAFGSLDIFLDTQGPQVTGVAITGKPGFDLFDPKPSTAGPTPRVDSLTISLRDLPNRAAGFLYEAILAGVAANPGLYVLRGDQNGVIAVSEVIVTNAPRVDGQPATATIELRFAAPLPDDRYTLTLAGTLVDPAGNALDGENNGAQPLETPRFPTGDGQPGGGFTARFTVDSAPEIGTYSFGAAYVDINGNGTFDPYGDDNDQTHRDIAFVFGNRGDQLFAGDFAPAGATTSSGFAKLAAFGQHGTSGPYRFLLDFDHDGVADLNVTSLVNGNGATAVAGNFAAGHAGDEVGLFNGQKWYLDSNGNHVLGDAGDVVLQGNLQGTPIVGDFDGDGKDDLAAYKNGVFSFDLASNGLTGNAEATINFGFFGPFEQPVAADLNLDGIDDIGLFLPERNGPPPSESAEWFWLVSTGTPVAGTVNTLNHPFEPVPFGNDRFFAFGSELAKPLVGNFDPPVTAANAGPALALPGSATASAGGACTLVLTPATPGAYRAGGWTVRWGDGRVETVPGDRAAVTHDYGRAPGIYTAQVTAADGAARTVRVTVNLRSTHERFVAQVYLDLLGRQVDPAGLASWTGRLDRGASRPQVVRSIEGSREYRTRVVQGLYQQVLHRAADGTGLNRFVAFLGTGGTVTQVQAALTSSAEYLRVRGGGTNAGFLAALYRDGLNRAIDPARKQAIGTALASGASRQPVVDQVFASPEYQRRLVDSTYQRFLRRAADRAGLDAWSRALRGGLSEADLVAAIVGSEEYLRRR